MTTKKKLLILGIVLLALVLLVSSSLYMLHRPAPVYETNDIADYRMIKGNYDNDWPKMLVYSVFPEKIEDYFSDVTYHYKAKKGDTFAYEMYLEFVIPDTQTYNNFITDTIGDNATEPFYFDSNYQVYYVSNSLYLSPALTITRDDKAKESIIEEDKSKPPVFENAKIGAILFSDAEQRIIFFALGVYDGAVHLQLNSIISLIDLGFIRGYMKNMLTG